VSTRKTLHAADVSAAFARLVDSIAHRHRHTPKLVLLGIANGGVPVCQRLAAELAAAIGHPPDHGVLNVTFQRDDIGRHPIPKDVPETHIPAEIEGATVILVDDVLFSGRTVRAALEEVFSLGRPTRVELAVLVDRGNRRLPIAADHIGAHEATSPEERVRVRLDPADPSADIITITTP
jgi:pyrimidine operon attenuation protein/uracil phosphoribosyltransferase